MAMLTIPDTSLGGGLQHGLDAAETWYAEDTCLFRFLGVACLPSIAMVEMRGSRNLNRLPHGVPAKKLELNPP